MSWALRLPPGTQAWATDQAGTQCHMEAGRTLLRPGGGSSPGSVGLPAVTRFVGRAFVIAWGIGSSRKNRELGAWVTCRGQVLWPWTSLGLPPALPFLPPPWALHSPGLGLGWAGRSSP